MLLAAGLSYPQLLLMGLSMLVIAFLLRRTVALRKRSLKRDPVAEVQRDMREAEKSSSARLNKMELRLYDYGREVEGRVETRIFTLDRLIHDADREIARLRLLIEQSRGNVGVSSSNQASRFQPGPDIVSDSRTSSVQQSTTGMKPAVSQLTVEQSIMIGHLNVAGYSAVMIAKLIDRSLGEVQQSLESQPNSDQADAA